MSATEEGAGTGRAKTLVTCCENGKSEEFDVTCIVSGDFMFAQTLQVLSHSLESGMAHLSLVLNVVFRHYQKEDTHFPASHLVQYSLNLPAMQKSCQTSSAFHLPLLSIPSSLTKYPLLLLSTPLYSLVCTIFWHSNPAHAVGAVQWYVQNPRVAV